MITLKATEGSKKFARGGETYTVTACWDDQDPSNTGWAYRVTSDSRGDLDSGEIDDANDPWGEIARMFPETANNWCPLCGLHHAKDEGTEGYSCN